MMLILCCIIFRLNNLGEVQRITYNVQARDYYLMLPPEQVKTVYKAMKVFDDLLYEKDAVVNIKLNDGE